MQVARKRGWSREARSVRGPASSSRAALGAALVAGTFLLSRPGHAAGSAPSTVGEAPFAAAAEMMPDDPVSPSEARALARLRAAMDNLARAEPLAVVARREVDELADQQPRLILRWLLAEDRRVALGYERAVVLDALIVSPQRASRALATQALLARPSLGYCMRALPPRSRAGRLSAVVRELELVGALRAGAARLVLSEGDANEAARNVARVRVERIGTEQRTVVRRFLLDQTDGGIFDIYRAEVVLVFLSSDSGPLRALGAEVAARRAHLTPPAGDGEIIARGAPEAGTRHLAAVR